MLTEQDRLRWAVATQDQIIRERNRTIQEQKELIEEYKDRMDRQRARLKSLLWWYLVLLVTLIFALAALLTESQ